MAAARDCYAGRGLLEDMADASAYKHNSFDLILHRNDEVKHIEVKGTTQKTVGSPEADIRIFLTPNEVAHARQGSGVFRECPHLSHSRPWRRRVSAGVVWSRRPSGMCR